MSVFNQVGYRVANAFRHMQAKQKAVKGGEFNFRQMHKYINGDEKLGKTVLWKKGGTQCLSTNGYSKTAGLANFVQGSREQEQEDFVKGMLAVAFANRNSTDADVKTAVGYLLHDWHNDNCEVTVPLQNAVKFLAAAQDAGRLI